MSLLKDYSQYLFAKTLLKKYSGITQPLQKMSLNPEGSYRFLIVSYDAIGDFILSTPTFVWLKKYFKNAKFDLICSDRNFALAEKLNYFSHIYKTHLNSNIFNQKNWDELRKIKNNNYDCVINLFDEPDHCALVKIIFLAQKPENIISLPIRFKNTYQQKLLAQQSVFSTASNNPTQHFSNRMFHIAHLIGAEAPFFDMTYHFPFVEKTKENKSQKINILINPAGSQTNNTLKKEIFIRLLESLQKNKSYQVHTFKNLYFETKNSQVITHSTKNIFEAAEIIQSMDLVISTDTSISHITTAAKKPLILIRSNEVWRKNFDPLYGKFTVLESVTNNINDIRIESFEKIISTMSGNL